MLSENVQKHNVTMINFEPFFKIQWDMAEMAFFMMKNIYKAPPLPKAAGLQLSFLQKYR